MRIREETEFRPKPMIAIGERPILWHIMKIYTQQDFHDVVICLGYKGDMITQYFLQYTLMHSDITISLNRNRKLTVHDAVPEESWCVTLAETGINAMTGARIKKIQKYVEDRTFMATYG